MARLPFLTAAQIPAGEPDILGRLEQERGKAPNVYRVLANAPRLADAFRTVALTLRNSTELDPRLRELAILTVAASAPSGYELAHHRPMALAAGVPAEQLDALDDFEAAPVFGDAERAVMRYAREATAAVEVSDSTWDALTAALPSDQQVLEVVLQVAWYNASARIMVPLRIELEEEYLESEAQRPRKDARQR
jgi:alkylhydroperoxidase family enzyme